MPQPRQRIVFCDCLDCVTQPPTADIASSASPANEAAAKQEPPPKCLLLVLSGVLLPRQHESDDTAAAAGSTATVLDNLSLPHLNRAVAQGNLCLLTLRAEGEKQEGSPAGVCVAVCLSSLFFGCCAVSLASNLTGVLFISPCYCVCQMPAPQSCCKCSTCTRWDCCASVLTHIVAGLRWWVASMTVHQCTNRSCSNCGIFACICSCGCRNTRRASCQSRCQTGELG